VVAALLNGPSAAKVIERAGALIKSHPQLTVLGVGLAAEPELLRAAMRAKLTELVDLPVDPEKLLTALQSVAEKVAQMPSGRLVAVRGTGGGCGASTIAANLAVELAKRDGNRVAVVDLDLRYGQIATMFDLSPSFTLSELAQQSEEYDERVLNSALAKHESGVAVLARPRDPEASSISLVKLSAILNALIETFDWVLVDETARNDLTSRIVQDLADELLLVTQLVVPSVRNASQIINGLSSGFNLDRLKVLVNRVPRKPVTVTVEKVTEILRRPVFAQIPEDWETVSRCINLGVPLAQQAPDSKVRDAIRVLAAELAGEAPRKGEAAGSGSMMGWLKNLRKG
jgi:pilus assembly protein CpaE